MLHVWIEFNLKYVKFFLFVVTVVFCCVGALAITGSLHHVDKDLLGWWLCERQVKSGGLNGRPEKLPDVGISSKYKYLSTKILIYSSDYDYLISSGLLFMVGSF